MCVLSIKVPIRKMSGNLSYAPRILSGPIQLLISYLNNNSLIWFGFMAYQLFWLFNAKFIHVYYMYIYYS